VLLGYDWRLLIWIKVNEIISWTWGTWSTNLPGLEWWPFHLRCGPILWDNFRYRHVMAKKHGWRTCKRLLSWEPPQCCQSLRFCLCRMCPEFSGRHLWLLICRLSPNWWGLRFHCHCRLPFLLHILRDFHLQRWKRCFWNSYMSSVALSIHLGSYLNLNKYYRRAAIITC